MIGTEFPEHWRIELPTVVTDQRSRNAKSTNDVPEHKIFHLFLGHGRQWLYLGPFGELVHYNNGKLDLTLCHWEWPDQVDAPLSERPWADD